MTEYRISNWDAVNQAVDTELTKHNRINSILASRLFINVALGILALCAAILLLVFAYKLYFSTLEQPVPNSKQRTAPVEPDYQSAEELEKVIKNSESVQESKNGETITSQFESEPAHKTYTIFFQVSTKSGEQVVTGRTFVYPDLVYPASQYCYLDKHSSSPPKKGREVVSLRNKDKDGNIIDLQTSALFVTLANRHCKFQ